MVVMAVVVVMVAILAKAVVTPPVAIKATITEVEAFIRVTGFTEVEAEMFLLLSLEVTLMMMNG